MANVTLSWPEGNITMTNDEFMTLYMLENGRSVNGLLPLVPPHGSPELGHGWGASPCLRGNYGQVNGALNRLRAGDLSPMVTYTGAG